MDDDFYRDFVARAGAALEAEDRLILGSSLVRNEAKKGGILRLNHERYYQSILWRAMLSRWNAAIEYHDRHDLALFDPNSEEPYAIFELKRWMSSGGDKELPSFSSDIQKLKAAPFLRSAFVIFSSNRQGEMAGHMDWLEEQWIKRQDFTHSTRRSRLYL